MPNQVFVDKNGYVSMKFEGDQSYQTVTDTVDRTNLLLAQIRTQNKPTYILIDLSKLGQTHSSARKVGAKALIDMDYDKAAIFGGNLFVKHMAVLVILASGNQDKAKFFRSEKEATQWLHS